VSAFIVVSDRTAVGGAPLARRTTRVQPTTATARRLRAGTLESTGDLNAENGSNDRQFGLNSANDGSAFYRPIPES